MESDPSSFLVSNMLAIATPTLSDYLLFAILILFVFFDFVACGAQIAFFALSQSDIEELSNSESPRDKTIVHLMRNSDRLFASINILDIFSKVFIFTLSFILFQHLLSPEWLNKPIWIVVLSILIVILIDITPKLYAASNPKKFSYRSANFINIIDKINSPLSSLLVNISNRGDRALHHQRHELSMDELSRALQMTSKDKEYEDEKDMLEEIIRFKDTIVDDIKVSRSDMIAVDITLPFDKVVDFIVDAGFSRIPVYEKDPDNIKGILYVKDLLPYLNRKENFKWQSLIRPAYFVPGTKHIEDLLEEFRTNKNHMAIVVDEYGATTGIVTMEDILEEIVGDISDEYDVETSFYTITPDGTYIFDGKTPLEDFFRVTGLSEEEFEQYTNESDTLAGFILELHGNFPKRKEIINFNDYQFQVEELTKRKIVKIRFIPPKVQKS
ncbi:MAG: Magnesium and cobalt efflux protein CorC [Bacteroidetes bacterium ADurb.BinA261]|nr:MAG: Magnesium and cobalt efflux protein CorC [Bacteroidetes bacterium ADurb.BinA261]